MSSASGPALLALAFLAFVALGLPDGLLGVAWPSMRARFGLPLDAIGPLLVAITTGAVAASFASGRVHAQLRVGTILAAACTAIGIALLGYALAPDWGVVVAFGLAAGLGGGAIDAALNTHVATHHSPRTLNWLHACYGLGATLGPLLMTAVLTAGFSWQRGYAIGACLPLALGLAFVATRARWPEAPARRTHAAPDLVRRASTRVTLRLPAAWLGMLAFFVYVGLEQTAGAWAFTLLTEARDVPVAAAGTWVSVYWGGLTAGRVAFGLVANRFDVRVLVRVVLAAIVGATLLIAFDPCRGASELGLGLLGFACGPVFPLLMAATPARLGAAHAANAVGFQVAAGALGQALAPWAVGAVAQRAGLEMIGASLVGLAAALVAVHEGLARTSVAGHWTDAAQPRHEERT